MNHPDPHDASSDETAAPDRRNELAIVRTELANERTLLSYSRTALMLAATGGTLIKLFAESTSMLVLGIVLLGLGAVTFVVGVWRFRMHESQIRP